MYKFLKKLRLFQQRLIDTVYQTSLLLPDNEKKGNDIGEDEIETINKNIKKLEKVDVFILLEAVYLSSVNFKRVIIKELEDTFTYIIYKWGNVYLDFVNDPDSIIIYRDLWNISYELNKIIDEGIDKINRFCILYLDIPDKNLLTNYEYQVIAKAHNLYVKATTEYYRLKNNKAAFTKYDELAMLADDISPEDYRETKLEAGIKLNYESFSEAELDVVEQNLSFIKSADFKVYFVSENQFNNDSRFSIEDIDKVWSFLLSENIMDTTLPVFRYVIQNKKLPKDANKILWRKSLTDARRLVKLFKLDDEIFNACFTHLKGKILTSNNRTTSIYRSNFSVFINNTFNIDIDE